MIGPSSPSLVVIEERCNAVLKGSDAVEGFRPLPIDHCSLPCRGSMMELHQSEEMAIEIRGFIHDGYYS
ncbi:MAG TPA: hypothetical protein PK843_17480 [bacterium]|nr:hypothetical protein [bacterium]